jgi:Major Facilitator Superfamily
VPPARRCWKPLTEITPKPDDGRPAPQRRCCDAPGGGRAVALAILCTLLFLTFLDTTIVSVGLGSVQADLHAGVQALQWIVGAYALTFASAMLAFGMVGDEFGRKKVMLAGPEFSAPDRSYVRWRPPIGSKDLAVTAR